jgi:predicted O-methyltransferase YrrM
MMEQLNDEKHYDYWKSMSNIRTLQLAQIFPGIDQVSVELGAIDPDTAHPNKVDMLYVVAISRFMKAKRLFEFGTYLGRTTAHLALGPDVEEVNTLDISPATDFESMKLGTAVSAVLRRGLQGHFYKQCSAANKVNQLHGDSRTFDYSPYEKSMDFIFVDAGHTYEFVKNDTQKALTLGAPGRVIVWHDYAAKARQLVKFFHEFSLEMCLFHVKDTSLLVHIDGVDPMLYQAPIAPYAREVLKPA